MEVYDTNPKVFSQSKRSQKFSNPKDKRKAHPNGQKLRKIYTEYYFTKNSEKFTFEKQLRGTDKSKHSIFGQTAFEQEMNTQMLTNLNYSLNKNRNWEKIPAIIDQVEAGEKCKVERGKEKTYGHKECEVIKIGYFDMQELEEQTNKLIKQQQKYEKTLNYNVDDINNYVKDRFYQTIIHKKDRTALKRWKEIQNVKPKNISKNCHFIQFKSISARSVKRGCKIRCATVKSFKLDSYWSPTKADDTRDYIQIDLGKNWYIEAVSTRGRCLVRNRNHEIDHQHSHHEFVRKYKVMIKKDDGRKVIKHTTKYYKKRYRHGDGKKDDDGLYDANEDFISLGAFDGNRDSESEVANILKLPNDNKKGVIARYIRIYPLSHAQGGYYGKKSMRVGVYGNDKCDQDKELEDEESEKEIDCSGGDLIRNSGVPAAIITINCPCETYTRNCWAVKGWNEGVFSCSCHGCKWSKFEARHIRKSTRNNFKTQVKKIRRVSDYGLDCDWIGYHPSKGCM